MVHRLRSNAFKYLVQASESSGLIWLAADPNDPNGAPGRWSQNFRWPVLGLNHPDRLVAQPTRQAVYQCAWNSASTVAAPAMIEPAIAIAAGMPLGKSRSTIAATNIAATGRAMTK